MSWTGEIHPIRDITAPAMHTSVCYRRALAPEFACCARPRVYPGARRARAQHHAARASQSSDNSPLAQQPADAAPSTSSMPTDPVQLVTWGGRPPSRRRLLLGSATATVLATAPIRPANAAVGSNFLGMTSALLSLDGGRLAAQLRIDTLVPVKGMKRCADFDMLYEFLYPSNWVADQTLFVRAARRTEQDHALDLPSAAEIREKAKSKKAEPLAAFGPPGTSGEENISIIVAPIFPGFKLSSLGEPQEQAKWFLSNIAYEGSGKKATLVNARSRNDGKQDYYEMEYELQSRTFKRHNISVYTTRDDLLYTFSAQCPEATWARDQEVLRKAAESFQLIPRA